jgi:hypothetical protein
MIGPRHEFGVPFLLLGKTPLRTSVDLLLW